MSIHEKDLDLKEKHEAIEKYIRSLTGEEMMELGEEAAMGAHFFSFDDWRYRWGIPYEEALKSVEKNIETLKADIEHHLTLPDDEEGKWELIARAASPLESWVQNRKQALNDTGFIFWKKLFE